MVDIACVIPKVIDVDNRDNKLLIKSTLFMNPSDNNLRKFTKLALHNEILRILKVVPSNLFLELADNKT